MKKFFSLFLLCSSFFTWSHPIAIIETNLGAIEVELFEDKAPITVKNFLSYVQKGFYNGLIFHRVIDGFMIQGGGYSEGMVEKKTDPAIKNEASNGLLNLNGTIAMARTSDPHSATSQFFININDNTSLNFPSPDGHGYAVFGKVINGMHVVNRIKMVKTGDIHGHANVPMDTIKIIKVVLKVGKKQP
jgi:cyclophilin family peptidyl-prolyl cis-trans isomerase